MKNRTAQCFSCGNRDLRSIIDFGKTPLADALLGEVGQANSEITADLELVFCPECSLVQLTESVSPEILFCRDYPYYSSVSPSLMRHFHESAANIITTRNLNANSLVIEAASNDGYMLRTFAEAGIPVMGIDPAEGPARAAQQKGIPTLTTFFTKTLAEQLMREGKKADVFLANNVLAHVPDLNGFIAGMRILLKENGIAIIEIPYVVDLVDHVEFDTIYHQHLCYFSVTALDKLFRRHALYINAVERINIHGGSLRLFVEPRESVGHSVVDMLSAETKRKVETLEFYLDFAAQVGRVKTELAEILTSLKQQGKRVAGYGAAAKATTMMAHVGIGRSHLEFIADMNTFKHGRYMGGNRIPIVPPSHIMKEMPDYVLILAWNFAREIMEQLEEYRKRGGKFIVPLPTPQILEQSNLTKDFAAISR